MRCAVFLEVELDDECGVLLCKQFQEDVGFSDGDHIEIVLLNRGTHISTRYKETQKYRIFKIQGNAIDVARKLTWEFPVEIGNQDEFHKIRRLAISGLLDEGWACVYDNEKPLLAEYLAGHIFNPRSSKEEA